MEEIKYKAIGIIRTPFEGIKGVPIQPHGAKGIKGTIEIKQEFISGLKDLDDFSHIILLYHFHKSENYSLHVIPFLDNISHGVFATRAPKRPNSIGMSVVKLVLIEDNIIHIENIDIIDGTPLLDIKPFVSSFNFVEDEKIGWLTNKIGNSNNIKADKRFT